MKIARKAGVVLGSVSAAIATLAAGLPARAADTPAWHIIDKVHYGSAANASGYSSVIAPAKNDAWVFGGTNPGGPSSPTAERWNGQRWESWPLPAGLNGFILAAAASSPNDIWAAGAGWVLHWNGVKWAIAKTWSQGGEITSVAAISRSDVWVFGSSTFSGEASLGTWHYNGHTWVRAAGTSGLYRASAVSQDDIWAITVSPHGGSVVHYTDAAWKDVPAADAALAKTQLDDVLAASRDNVWVSGTSPVNAADGHLVLAHWNGRSWKRFTAPWLVEQPERFATDGQGGIWIPVVTGVDRPAMWILHLSRTGAWTRTQIPDGSDTGVGVGDLTLIPGTTTLWGTGGLLTTAGGDAAIWDHGVVVDHLAVRDHPATRAHLTVGDHGVIRVYLTVGGRAVVWVYLAIHGCRTGAAAGGPLSGPVMATPYWRATVAFWTGQDRAGVCSCAASASSSAKSSASSRASILRRSSIRARVSTWRGVSREQQS
jgi:hypothetical protein